MPIGPFIRGLREKSGMSQDSLAKVLKISRPTVVKLEKGSYDLTLVEARKAATLFDLSIDDLLNEKVPSVPQVTLPKMTNNKVAKPIMRINVPQKRLDVFKQVLLYVLGRIGAKPNVGETVLYKILYFIDFDFYEKYEEQLIGATYIKNHYGPTPVEFRKIIGDMIEKGEVEAVKSTYFAREQKKYLPRESPDLSKFDDGRSLALIDEVLAKYGDMSANQISELSHRDVPWMTADEGSPIDYESVFYRTPEFSVRSYDDARSN